eukprot:maker-scaffold_12-snap-gene-12.13-mRNA-1 protein AED:0.00 eAED:0.00 QI:39/1/1/1/1/1/2/1439/239
MSKQYICEPNRNLTKEQNEMADPAQDINCPICMEVFTRPLSLDNCTHNFCEECISHLTSVEEKDRKCPLCRVPFQAATLNADLVELISSTKSICEPCGKTMDASLLESHQTKCKKFIAHTKKLREQLAVKEAEVKDSKNRSTFTCPFSVKKCKAKNLDVKSLLDHLNKKHKKEGPLSATCPVCASMPWGDPNYRSSDVVSHINMRHKFEYGEYVDYNEFEQQDEDFILQQVLAASLADK